jgi:predicted DNA-binding protein (MmcQ/YjbR family)
MVTADQVRIQALALPGSEERETWHRPTFRVGDEIFATLHDDLLILRSTKEHQEELLASDARFQPAPYWGRNGWVAVDIDDLAEAELPQLLAAAHALIA